MKAYKEGGGGGEGCGERAGGGVRGGGCKGGIKKRGGGGIMPCLNIRRYFVQ